MFRTTLAILCAMITTAHAECVTRETLSSRGIRVGWEDGGSSVFTAVGDILTEENHTAADGHKTLYRSAHGAYPLTTDSSRSGVFTNKNRIDYTYAVKPADMPVPAAGSDWRTRVTASFWDGGRPSLEIVREGHYQWGPAQTITAGGCSYTMIEGRYTFTRDGEWFYELYEFFPDLGIGLWTGQAETATSEPDRFGWTTLGANP